MSRMKTIIELIKSICSLSNNSFMSMSRRNLVSHIRKIQKEVNCLDFYVNRLEKEIRAKTIDECIKYLNDYFGVAEAKKYGNKTREQLEVSYQTWMNYEIKDGIEELAELKEGEQNE